MKYKNVKNEIRVYNIEKLNLDCLNILLILSDYDFL